MKKFISLLALVLALTMVMSVSAFAAPEFSVEETITLPGGTTVTTAADDDGVTVTPAADSIDITVPATSGADYSILLVSGTALPTSESTIAYINQVQANGTSVAFDVLPKMTSVADGINTIYIGSNAEGAQLISIPVTYAEPPVAGYMTGDVDDSKVIDGSDALMTLKIAAEKITPTALEKAAADVDESTVVDGSDALLILKYAAEKITSWK